MRRLAVALLLVLVGSPSARADWEVKRSPFDARVVARYKQLVHANPDDADALARLTALYKQYKSLDALSRELSATAEKSRDGNDWLALGNLARNRGDFAGAAKAYAAALERAPDDARALGALGDADVRLGKGNEARPLYERALAQTKDPKRQRPLLKKLIDLALAPDRGLPAKEALAEARKHYDALVKLDPRDDDARQQWAEALAAHGQPGEAAAEWRALAVGARARPGAAGPGVAARRRARRSGGRRQRGARRLRQDVRAGAEGQLSAARSGRQDRRFGAQAGSAAHARRRVGARVARRWTRFCRVGIARRGSTTSSARPTRRRPRSSTRWRSIRTRSMRGGG